LKLARTVTINAFLPKTAVAVREVAVLNELLVWRQSDQPTG
jgi:hypothetical protein